MSQEAEDTFDLAAREAAREELEKQRAQAEHQLDTDYMALMQTGAGRRVMWDLLAPIWRTSYVSQLREDTFFREGERNVALRVWARLLRVTPSLAHKLLEEYQK
jgi:hypothetical protein